MRPLLQGSRIIFPKCQPTLTPASPLPKGEGDRRQSVANPEVSDGRKTALAPPLPSKGRGRVRGRSAHTYADDFHAPW